MNNLSDLTVYIIVCKPTVFHCSNIFENKQLGLKLKQSVCLNKYICCVGFQTCEAATLSQPDLCEPNLRFSFFTF